jgi:predicted metal-dependent enzyme (double-stranded beta helix superfamily)
METTTTSRSGFGIEELTDRIKTLSTRPDFGPGSVRELLSAALARPGDWLPDRLQVRGAQQGWVLYPLYRAPDGRVSVLVAVFAPGVPSPVHDHGTWVVVGTYRGRERETRYRRLEDSSVRGRVGLGVERTFINPAGVVSVVPGDAIHSVEALDGRDAVSIHVYGADIVTQERSTYDLLDGTASVYRPEFSNG